jgi:aspartyl-tRNA(Asn)/glutamyl-tRNA(Gln) amidotransferase subunit A
LEYLEAVGRRSELAIHMGRFHARYDLLLTPAVPIPAFEAGREVPEGSPHRRWTSWTPFTYPFNLTQQPAASVPCGFTSAGLPVGLQIVGAKYKDALVLRAAHAYQTANPLADRRPS